jgi:ubiquinone biosynthesis protein UbiJ
MSSCMRPLLDFVGEEEQELAPPEAIEEFLMEVDPELEKAIDEVVSGLQKGLQR